MLASGLLGGVQIPTSRILSSLLQNQRPLTVDETKNLYLDKLLKLHDAGKPAGQTMNEQIVSDWNEADTQQTGTDKKIWPQKPDDIPNLFDDAELDIDISDILGDIEGAGKIPKYPGNDPSIPPSLDYEWRGSGEPGTKQGNWYNPGTKEWLRPDIDHPGPIKPHWDYCAPDGKVYRIYSDGTYELK